MKVNLQTEGSEAVREAMRRLKEESVAPPCKHVWNGPPAEIDGGRGWTATCGKCGVDAMSVTLSEGI